MTPKQIEILDWLSADLRRCILVVSYKGTECYNADEPVGTGILAGSDIEQLESMGSIVRDGDCFRLP